MRVLSRAAAVTVALTLVLAWPAFATTVNVDIRDFAFDPQALTVRVGDTVIWVNQDPTVHRVHWTGGQFPDSQNLQQRQAYPLTFTAAGVYPYICGIHPSMHGSITVLPAPTPTPTPRTTPTPSPTVTPSATPSPSASPTESPTPPPTASPSPSRPPTGSPSVSPSGSPLASPAVQTNAIVGVALIAVGVAILIGALWWRFSRV